MNRILKSTYDKVVDKRIFSAIRWNELIICLIGFMVGRINMLNGWNPLSVAYIGASYQTKNLQRWNSFFTILGILSVSQPMAIVIKYIGTIFLIFLVRWYMEGMDYKAGFGSQLAISTGSAFTISIIIIASQGFTMYDFVQSILEIIFIFTFIFIYEKGISLILENKRTPLTNQEVIGITILLVSMIGGMVELYIEFSGGSRIYIRDIMCFFIILTVSYLGGTAVGAAMGTVIGTLLVTIGYIPPHLISIYALSGLGGGILASLGKVGTSIGVLAGHMLGIYFINDGVVDFSLLGAYTASSLVFLLCPKDFFGFSYWFGDKEKEYQQEVHMRRIQQLTSKKLENFAASFNKLASTFNSISSKKISLTKKDISCLLDDVVSKSCVECSLVDFCWKRDFYNSYQSAYEILAIAERKDKILPSDIPEEFKRKCIRLESFVQALDQTFELYKQDLVWQNRVAESRELISQQLDSVSTIIKELSSEIEQEVVFKRDIEKQVKEELTSQGIKVKDVIIIIGASKKYEVTIISDWSIENSRLKKLLSQF